MSWLPPDLGLWAASGLVVLSFFTAIVTTSAGIGGGVIMLAAMASLLPPQAVIPVHGVVQLGANSGRAALLARHVVRPVVGYFAVGAALGAAIGGLLYVALPGHVLKLILALFILYSVWGPNLSRQRIANPLFVPVGVVTTFITMFVGGTGPFVAAFVSPDRYGKESTVATHGACMTLQHGFKVATFAVLGFAYLPWLPLMVAMVCAGFMGTIVGRAVLLRLPERTFRIVFKTALTVLALRLLYSAMNTFMEG